MEKKKMLGVGIAVIAATSMLAACGSTNDLDKDKETEVSKEVDKDTKKETVAEKEGKDAETEKEVVEETSDEKTDTSTENKEDEKSTTHFEGSLSADNFEPAEGVDVIDKDSSTESE